MPTKRVNKLVGKKTRNQVRDEALEQQHLRDEQLLDARANQRSSTAGSDESADITVFEQAAETLANETAPTPGPVTLPVGEGTLVPAVTAEPVGEGSDEVVGEWPVAEVSKPRSSGQALEGAQQHAEQPAREDAVPAQMPVGETRRPEPATREQTIDVAPTAEPVGEGRAMSAPAIHPSGLAVADSEAVRGLERYSNPLTGPRATTVPIGVSFSRTSLDHAKRAYSSDKHRIPGGGPTSFVRWLQRAVHQHLALSLEERETALESAPPPDDGGRKISYNVVLPYDLHHQLMAELDRAEMEGWQVNKSAFVREAVAVAIGQALIRANVTQFPPLKGKLKHAR